MAGQDVFRNLRGTLALLFSIGKQDGSNVQLKNNGGILEIRNDDDTDFQVLRAAGPVADNDVATKFYVDSVEGVTIVDRQADWDRAIREGLVDASRVRELLRTPEYFDYNWTVRPDLDERFGDGFSEELVDALLRIADPEVLDLFSTGGFVRTENSNYDAILDVARSLGIVDDG